MMAEPPPYSPRHSPFAIRSSAIPQSRRNAVDRQLNAGQHLLVAGLAAMQLEQLDLHMVQGIEIGEAVADRAVEQRIGFEPLLVAHNGQQGVDRIAPLAA